MTLRHLLNRITKKYKSALRFALGKLCNES